MSPSKRVTKGNRKNTEYHVVAAIRKLAKPVPQKNHAQTMLKMSSISDLKIMQRGPYITGTVHERDK